MIKASENIETFRMVVMLSSIWLHVCKLEVRAREGDQADFF